MWPPFAGITQVRSLAVGSSRCPLSPGDPSSRVSDSCRECYGQSEGWSSGRDADQYAPAGAEALADVPPHPEGHDDPVLAPVGPEDGLFEIAPVVHPLGAALEGRALPRTDVDRDAPVVPDPARLEAR